MNFYFASRISNLKYIKAGSELSIWPHIVHNLNRYHLKSGKVWRNEDLDKDYMLTPSIHFKKGKEPSGVPFLYTGEIPDKDIVIDKNFPYKFKNKKRINVEKLSLTQHFTLIDLSESIEEFFSHLRKS